MYLVFSADAFESNLPQQHEVVPSELRSWRPSALHLSSGRGGHAGQHVNQLRAELLSLSQVLWRQHLQQFFAARIKP